MLLALAETGRQVPYGHLLFYEHLMKSYSWASEISACLLSCGKNCLLWAPDKVGRRATSILHDRSIYRLFITININIDAHSVHTSWPCTRNLKVDGHQTCTRTHSCTYAFTRKRVSVTSLISDYTTFDLGLWPRLSFFHSFFLVFILRYISMRVFWETLRMTFSR